MKQGEKGERTKLEIKNKNKTTETSTSKYETQPKDG
jgi:hypothetical protein